VTAVVYGWYSDNSVLLQEPGAYSEPGVIRLSGPNALCFLS